MVEIEDVVKRLVRDVKEIRKEIDEIWSAIDRISGDLIIIKRTIGAKQPRSRPRRHSGRAYY